MSIKIKQLSISGLRGIKSPLILPLYERSILLYGDNGTGKSSISDSLEWFYTDAIAHLSSNEIDLKDALRNCYLDETDTSFIKINYNKSILDGDKNLVVKRGKLTSEFSNTSEEFKNYIGESNSENLLLRYQFLRDFIDQTKGDKLKILSDIIGFSEVTKAKEILKKSFNSLKGEIKNQNFENQINTQKQSLIEKIGAAVSREENLFERINEIIGPYKTGIEVRSLADIDKVLNHIKAPVNNKLISELSFLENCKASIDNLRKEVNFLDTEYIKYFTEFDKISNDVQGIMQTFLADLLNVGKKVLEKKYHKDESCPLCLQPKSIEDLKLEINNRLKEVEASSKKKITFDNYF